MRIDHWKIGNSLADRHAQERQQSKPRPVTTIRVQDRPYYRQGGDIAFLDISEMWNMALGCSHVPSDAPAQSQNFNLFTRPAGRFPGHPQAYPLSTKPVRLTVGHNGKAAGQ